MDQAAGAARHPSKAETSGLSELGVPAKLPRGAPLGLSGSVLEACLAVTREEAHV